MVFLANETAISLMESPFKSTCMVGVFGLLGVAGIVGAAGAAGFQYFFWVLPHRQKQAKAIEQLQEELEGERDANQRNTKEIKQLQSDVARLNQGTLLPQIVVSKPDNLSVAEVADLVKILNAQIEQAASLVTDSLFDQQSPSSVAGPGFAWDRLEDYLGSWLCNDLRRRSIDLISEPDPLITQIALQTGLANACSRIINNWDPPFWIEGSIFSRIYNRIEETKGQATAEAWRVLSRSYMTVSQNERQEANKRYLTEVLVKLVTAVGGPLESGGTLPLQYNEKVEDIARKAVALHKIVTEDVTSLELATYTVPSGRQFDPSEMEDTEGNRHENGFTPHGNVICTVEMGLRCRKRVERGKQNGSREKWAVTAKCKVVLAATIEA